MAAKDPRYSLTCKRCGFGTGDDKWYPRVPNPKKCPKCGSEKHQQLKTARKK